MQIAPCDPLKENRTNKQLTVFCRNVLLACLLSIGVMERTEAADARPHSTELTITGLDELQLTSRTVSGVEANPIRERIAPVSIVGSIRGLGRVDVRLVLKRNLLPGAKGIFLQGTVALGGGLQREGSSRVVPAAASIVGGKLSINFLGRSKRSKGRSKLYAIRGALSASNTVRASVSSPASATTIGSLCDTHEEDSGTASGLEVAVPDRHMSASGGDGPQDKIISISTDADEQWYALYDEYSNSEIARIINAAETLYFAPHGLRFAINTQHVYTEQSPYTDNRAGGVLNQFVTNPANPANLAKSREEYFTTVDAKHLFTGKDLVGNAVGIAYMSTMCSYPALSFGLSQATPNDTTIAIFAHEISHTLGATHDINSPDTLMYPSLSGWLPEGYSSRSLEEIQKHLASFSGCLEGKDAPPTAEPTPTPMPRPTVRPEDTPHDDSNGDREEDETFELEIKSRRGYAGRGAVTIKGYLRGSNSGAIQGAAVQLWQKGQIIETGTTDARGRVEFSVPFRKIPRQGALFQLRTVPSSAVSKLLRVSGRR